MPFDSDPLLWMVCCCRLDDGEEAIFVVSAVLLWCGRVVSSTPPRRFSVVSMQVSTSYVRPRTLSHSESDKQMEEVSMRLCCSGVSLPTLRTCDA